MTEPPDLGITGQELYDNTEPAQYNEPATDYAWARFLSALSLLLDPVADVTRPTSGEDQWIVLASPERCPSAWLPVLAQWAGVRRPDALTEEQLRDLIGPTAPGMWRGTRAAMYAAVKRYYPPETPPEAIYFEERADGDPYLLRVFTYETWEHDPALVQQALLHEKPAGLNLIYEVRVGQTWGMLKQRKPTWGDVKADYATWGDVKLEAPI
jgi:tail protein P2 I